MNSASFDMVLVRKHVVNLRLHPHGKGPQRMAFEGMSGGLHFSGYGFEIWEISTDVLCLTKRTFSFLCFSFSGPDGTGVYECFSDHIQH